MTITGSNTTHFNFQKIGSNDDAGYSTIGEVIDSIDTLLDASDRLIADAQSPSVGYTIEWNGSDWVAGQLDTAGIADSAVTSAKIADGTIVNADVNASAAIDKTKISGTAVTIADTGTVTSTMILDGTILNADVNSAAAITYSKLNLATSIVNADISASAAIVDTKLATISTASKVSNSATTATDANTASAIVARDASGNFTAGMITANVTGALTGNASTSTTATNLAGGAGGSIPYQSAASTTAMLANGSAGQILTSNGTTLAPTFESISSGSVTLAGDVAGAANANSIGVGAVTSSKIANDTIVNEDINSAAAIAYSKLSLGTSIVNADISASAAIAYSKLNLTNSVTSADIVSVTLNQIPSYESYRNLIHNGAMQVAQRGTPSSGNTTGDYRTVDRFRMGMASFGTWTESVENDAPTGSGFRKSFKALCTTAQASPGSTADVNFMHKIEGQDLQRIAKGTASAKQLTLSFWVKSNLTGTYIARILDNDNTRNVSAAYTINASATWEKKTVTFPADTTGAFDNDVAESIRLSFYLGVGSGLSSGTLATSWETVTNANIAVGQVNLAATANNYWQVTGVQLETGSVATPFEFEPFETTLRKCQRYYFRISPADANVESYNGYSASSTLAMVLAQFPVEMRIAPTSMETTATASNYGVIFEITATSATTLPALSATTKLSARFSFSTAAVMTVGRGVMLRHAVANAYIGFVGADL